MNFYDKIHELVKELKETQEYVTYMQMKEKIKENPALYEKVKEFKNKQRNQQIKYVGGTQITEKEKNDMQDLYSKIIQNADAAKLFEAEIRLNVLLTDIQKILGEGIQDVWNF